MHIKRRTNIKQQRAREQGLTLLEVLLYIGLFSILCVSIISLYISISKMATTIKTRIQQSEIAFFVHEITRHKLDTNNGEQIQVEDFARILKYYPHMRMVEIVVHPIETVGANPFAKVTYKITYKLAFKNSNGVSEKIYSNYFYISAL